MVEFKGNVLKEFIDYSVSKGISGEQVKKILLESGWSQKVIDKIFVKGQKQTLCKGKGQLPALGNDVLRLNNITKSYGMNLVLDNVNLSINHGEIVGIIGISGSGKTTLLNTLVGFVDADEGEVIVKSPDDQKSRRLFKNPEIAKHFFGFAAQNPSFYGKLTVEENLEYFAVLYNVPKKVRQERCNSLIGMVNLVDSRKVLAQNLSGGMQKRLDIACSLVHKPRVLILDEPTADLDPLSRDAMWKLVRHINEQGTTVILASHFVNELEDICTRFAILHNRRISEIGTPDELKAAYSKNYEIILEVKSGKYDKIIREMKSKKGLQIKKTTLHNGVLTIFTPKPEQTLYNLARLIEKIDEKIIDIRVSKPTIRELFESLVKHEEPV